MDCFLWQLLNFVRRVMRMVYCHWQRIGHFNGGMSMVCFHWHLLGLFRRVMSMIFFHHFFLHCSICLEACLYYWVERFCKLLLRHRDYRSSLVRLRA